MLLRERHKDLQGLGVKAAGISVDHVAALRVFDAATGRFPFPLAADWHRGICRQYGVLDAQKQAARRVLMLCDADAVVRHVVEDWVPKQVERFEELLQSATVLR